MTFLKHIGVRLCAAAQSLVTRKGLSLLFVYERLSLVRICACFSTFLFGLDIYFFFNQGEG